VTGTVRDSPKVENPLPRKIFHDTCESFCSVVFEGERPLGVLSYKFHVFTLLLEEMFGVSSSKMASHIWGQYRSLETGIDMLFRVVDQIEIRYDSLIAVHRVTLEIKLVVEED
jgi:hypothetical protein